MTRGEDCFPEKDTCQTLARARAGKSEVDAELEIKLERIKRRVGMGFEVNVKWLPGITRHKNGKKLLEEVSGNKIYIYVEDPTEAKKLLAHGFTEWLLNQHTKKYRLLINKLIEVFEQIQYQDKEKIVDAISKILTNK